MFSFFLTRGREKIDLCSAIHPVVSENEGFGFELVLSPETELASWRIRLGDMLPEDPLGRDFGTLVSWPRAAWFDCSRGSVTISVERNLDSEASPHGSAGWEMSLAAKVLVRPAKLTDDEWIAMRGDLEAVAVDLANDLVGKASAGAARAMRARTPLDDLAAARQLLSRLDRAVQAIVRQPHAVLAAAPERMARTPRRLDAATLKRLLARGVDPRRCPTANSGLVVGHRMTVSYDVGEHRQILGTLRSAIRTLLDGEQRARAEIGEIEGDRRWRERPDDLPGASLYERLDYPRIQRLRDLLHESAQLRHWAARIAEAPVLAALQPEFEPIATLVSRHRSPYRLALRAALAWRIPGRVQIDAGDLLRRKDTDRMYEQWVFLQFAAGLRALGFKMDREEEIFRRMSARRYILDLPRGARLSFEGPFGSQIDLYFEPWIRPKEVARRLGDAFFHGRGRDAAWSPDVLLTMQATTELNARAIVIDAKYTRQVKEEHWLGVRKYMQIRRLSDDGFPVSQVWIAAPGSMGIELEDDSILWNENGPNLPAGSGNLQGTIGLRPSSGRGAGDPATPMLEFLRGILAYNGLRLPDSLREH